MKDWFHRNWKWLAGVACGGATAAMAFTPAAPFAAITGSVCIAAFGSATYDSGHKAGEAVGKAVATKQVESVLGAVHPVLDVLRGIPK